MRSRNSIQLAAFSAFLLLAIGGPSWGQDQIQWLDDLDQAKALAARDGKLLLVHFWSERCGPCKSLDTFVFPRPDVARAVHQHYIPVKVNTDENRGLTASLQIDRIPQDVFMLPDGKVIAKEISRPKANQYIQMVQAVADRASSSTPGQGMERLTSGRTRVAGLQSTSDSVPVVSASDLGARSPGQSIRSNSPTIQVTDRMSPTADGANLANNYANNYGQPAAAGYGNAAQTAAPRNSSEFSNPYATTAGRRTAELETTAAQRGTSAPELPPAGASFASPGNNPGPQLPPMPSRSNMDTSPSGSPTALQLPPANSGVNATGSAGANRPAVASGPQRNDFANSASPAPQANAYSGADRYSAGSIGGGPATPGTSQSPSAAQTPAGPRGTSDLALPPATTRSATEPSAPQTAGNAPYRSPRSGLERQYADPSRFAVHPNNDAPAAPVESAPRHPALPPQQSGLSEMPQRSGSTPNGANRELAIPPGLDQSPAIDRNIATPETPSVQPPNSPAYDPDHQRPSLPPQSVGFSPSTEQRPAQSPGQGSPQGLGPQQNMNPQPSAETNPPASASASEDTRSNPAAAAAPQDGPSIALEGYCPVTLVEHKDWVQGNKEFGCIHRGRLYLFCSATHRDRFLQFPDRFAPMLSGYDPVIFAEEQKLVDGKREHGVFAGGRVYMFASEQTLKQFYSQVDRYTSITHEAMGLPQAPTRTAQNPNQPAQR